MSGWEAALMQGIQSTGDFGSTLYATAANKRQAEEQRNWVEEMWHMENAYNSPEQQMQRFREAGLSPNLIYGQGTPGNAGQHMSYQRAQIDKPQLNLTDTYMRAKMQQTQIENMEADTAIKEKESIIKSLEAMGLEINNRTDAMYLMQYVENYDTRVAAERIQNQMNLNNVMIQNQNIDYNWIRNNKEYINMQWMETEKTLSAIKSREEIENLRTKNLLNDQEYQYIKKNGWRIPTKVMPGIFGKILNGGKSLPETVRNFLEESINQIPRTKRGLNMDEQRRKNNQGQPTGWGGRPNL